VKCKWTAEDFVVLPGRSENALKNRWNSTAGYRVLQRVLGGVGPQNGTVLVLNVARTEGRCAGRLD
jgi:hypothetical protein